MEKERKIRQKLESEVSQLKEELKNIIQQAPDKKLSITDLQSPTIEQLKSIADLTKQLAELNAFKQQTLETDALQKTQQDIKKTIVKKQRIALLGIFIFAVMIGLAVLFLSRQDLVELSITIIALILFPFYKYFHSVIKQLFWQSWSDGPAKYFNEYSMPKKEDIFKTHIYGTYCWRTVHIPEKKPCVIKLFDWSLVSNDSEAAEELKFAERLKKISNHLHIVRVLNTGYKRECGIYYIMERCDGNLRESIQQRQKDSSGYQLKDVIDIITQVLDGLAELHRNNFVHRDIKPENIYVKDGLWKIGDFGGVRLQRFLGEISSRGTYPYRAPEVRLDADEYLKADRNYFWCDIYSTGLVLKELLTLIPYWELQSSNTNTKPSYVNSNLWAVVLKAIEKEPKNRYQSAEEFLEALANIRPQ